MDVRKYSISAKRYDVIISNPAQMPSFSDTCDWNHDVAGYDGTSMIYRICDIAKIGLKEQGQLILLVFGFLLPKVKSYLSDIGFIMLRDMPMIKQCSPSGKILSSVSLNRHLYPEFDWDNVVQTHTLPTSILFARRGNA